MSVPTAELTVPAPATDVAARNGVLREWVRGGRLYLWLAGAALLIGVISLVIPSTPSYDPWAWLIWGREIAHINLQTTGGPSWKPLPVLFTTVFSVFGHAQPEVWLVIARAGAVMAVVMVFKLAWRLTATLAGLTGIRDTAGGDTAGGDTVGGDTVGGETAGGETAGGETAGRGTPAPAGRLRRLAAIAPLLAGLIAAGSLINSSGFISNNALGYSEGLATALALIAVDSYLDGAPRRAFVIGFFAALDRPELWFVWGPYGLYLFWRDPGARKLVVAMFALIPVLWFLPELWGSGHLLRGVTRAQHPRSNSAAFTKCPVCTVFRKEAWPAVWDRVKIPGMIALVVAAVGLWRTREAWWKRRVVDEGMRARAWLLALGVFGYVWWLGVAIETQAGFSGNNRYLVLGTAPVAIAGGVAWGWFSRALADWLRRLSARRAEGSRLGVSATIPAAAAIAVVLFLALPSWIGKGIVSLPRTHHALVYQAHLRSDLTAAVKKAGGAHALLSCGPVMTEGFQVPMVAWTLGVHTLQIEATPNKTVGPPGPAVILQTRAQSTSHLLPTPAQILAWEQGGTRYHLIAHVRTFRVFSTCAAKVAG